MSAIPSHLHSPARPSSLNPTHSIHPSKLREFKEKRMAYTQTFQLAQRARVKLQREASLHDHNLRLLVGHANLLDSLMLSLAQAEREQELWFDEIVRKNLAEEEDEEEEEEEEVDVRMAIDFEFESDSDDDESDEESDEEMEEIEYAVPRLIRKTNHVSLPALFGTVIGVSEVEEYEDEQEEEDEDGMYPLHRTVPQHGSPPQLVADLSDDEEEEATPPSPPQTSLPFTSPKGKERIDSSSYFDSQSLHPPDDSHESLFAPSGYLHRPAISSF